MRKLIVLALILVGCASSMTPAQKDWMARRDRQPLQFVVSVANGEAAWQRAQQWVARFGELPIKTANDITIQTEQPAGSAAEVGMTITRMKLSSGDWQFSVDTAVVNPFSTTRSVRIAQACAYYAASGIPYPG